MVPERSKLRNLIKNAEEKIKKFKRQREVYRHRSENKAAQADAWCFREKPQADR